VQQEWDRVDRLERITNENGKQSWFVWNEMDHLIQEVGFDGRIKPGRLG
jgi:YD repeat-containing protein